MENTTIRAEVTRNERDAGENRLQPKTYRFGVNFQLIIEIDEQKNIIDITDYKVRD